VSEDVEPVLAGDLVIVFPIGLRRIGFAEIDGAIGQLNIVSEHGRVLLQSFYRAKLRRPKIGFGSAAVRFGVVVS
jgi:hypothetical protein